MEGVTKEETLPPGFRFHPSDEELISYYLKHKISDSKFTARAIADVDLNKCEPWDLPGKAKMGEKEWYFFSLKDRKYPTGVRTNRATTTGYWKTTGKDKEIFSSSSSSTSNGNNSTNSIELLGMKKTLVFYKGRAPRGEKTNWVMHEYRSQPKTPSKRNKDDWVVCRVFMKSSGAKKYPAGQARPNPYALLDVGPGIMPSLVHADPYHLGFARSYLSNTEVAELTRFARGTAGVAPPIQPQLNFPFSALNLNLAAAAAAAAPPPPPAAAFRAMPAAQAQVAAAEAPPLMSPACMLTSNAAGFNIQVANHIVGNNGAKFQTMDSCMDLESYWPPY